MERKANLLPEIIEAIHLMYEDYPSVELDCILYLKNLVYDPSLSQPIYSWLEEHNRCEYCGEKLGFYTYKEPHSELDDCPMEELNESYCPNCDEGGNK